MNGVLDNVKVGDNLFVVDRWNKRIETVEKVTKLHVLTRYGKYRKNGDSVGDGWTHSYARLASQEDIEYIHKVVARRNMLAKCRDINFDSLTNPQLEAILKIANKEQGGEND